MNIQLYNYKNERNRLTKQLSSPVTITGSLTDDNVSIIDPTFKLSFNEDYLSYNYAYVPAFKRYYFIESMSVDRQCIILQLHCDVLMSFNNDIQSSTATVIRTSSGNKYIADNMIVQTSKLNRQVKKIGSGFTRNEKFIVQIGG